jgi:predicted ATPase
LPDGSNVFALLNRWQGWWPDKDRYEFVVESLRECFGFFGNLSFLPSGQFIEGWIVHRKYPGPGFPASQSAEGWLVALLHFTAVASANAGDVVGIDSFENALHPRAVTKAVELIRGYAERKGISVVLTTQSPQVIDCFEALTTMPWPWRTSRSRTKRARWKRSAIRTRASRASSTTSSSASTPCWRTRTKHRR